MGDLITEYTQRLQQQVQPRAPRPARASLTLARALNTGVDSPVRDELCCIFAPHHPFSRITGWERNKADHFFFF